MHQTLPFLKSTDFPSIRRRTVRTVQVNLGYKCNQSCVHCHVNAGPNRTEQMSRDTVDLILDGSPRRQLPPSISWAERPS
jgi:MoaA/NifB/PqqE/SkfB family radical SAM enzyme